MKGACISSRHVATPAVRCLSDTVRWLFPILFLLTAYAHAGTPQTTPLSATTGLIERPASTPAKFRLSVLDQLDDSVRQVVKNAYQQTKGERAAPTIVHDTLSFPWRYVGYLEIQHSATQVGTCSGTLISRHLVLTAAHCLYSEQKGILRNVTFFPSLQGRKMPLGRYKAKDILFLSPVRGALDNNLDVAFIVLEQSPFTFEQYNSARRVPVGVVDNRHFEQSKKDFPLAIVTAGYPTLPSENPNAGRLIVEATTDYRNSIVEGKSNQFEHQAITEEGTSGGPIFAVDPLYNQFALIGLISAQRTWSSGEVWAVGIKINPFTQKRILEIVRQYEPDYAVYANASGLR
jgi:V8-like Glu-specific endopeptidase